MVVNKAGLYIVDHDRKGAAINYNDPDTPIEIEISGFLTHCFLS